MKTVTLDEAKIFISEMIDSESIIGIRGDDFTPTENFNNSCVWEDGVKSLKRLSGLCAIEISDIDNVEWAIRESKKYGNNCYLIVGSDKLSGNDVWADEIIIADHIIYAKIEA